MQILHVNAAYPPFLGGAEVYTQAISEYFQRAGDEVTVVTTNAGEVEFFWNPRKFHVSAGRENQDGIQVIRCSVGHLPFSPWSFYALRKMATILARLPIDLMPVFRHIAPHMPSVPDIEDTLEGLSFDYDVVHGINVALEWPLLAAWRYARFKGVPFVTTPFVHVGEHDSREVLINYIMPHQLEALQDADAVIVQTDIEKQALTQVGIAPQRIYRLGMGVDLAELRGGSSVRFRERYNIAEPIITFLGVVTYDKGSFHLIRAMEQLWAQGSDAHLVVGGPTVDEFEHFYKSLSQQTRQRISLLGPVLGESKQDLLAATDIFVLPSRIDSFGIVYLEAWSYSKPVIGARAGGVPDVITQGEDGLLVDFGDVDDLAVGIATLLDDSEKARSMGQRGREKVENHYTWEQICETLRGVYEHVVHK